MEEYSRFKELGVQFQVNLNSFGGHYGPKAKNHWHIFKQVRNDPISWSRYSSTKNILYLKIFHCPQLHTNIWYIHFEYGLLMLGQNIDFLRERELSSVLVGY